MKQLFCFISLMILFFCANAQVVNDSTRVVIKMKNGDELRGNLVKRDSGTIVLRTVNGEMNLIAANVRSITRNDYYGRFDFENPNSTRYFFGPSAIPLKHGKGYYQNVEVVANFINVGVTDNLSVGGGVEFISLFAGDPIWFFTPKLGFEMTKNVHFGLGVLMVGLADVGSASVGYGVLTLGSNDDNLSLGIGYGIAEGNISNSPVITVSGMHRAGRSFGLLTENYLFPGNSRGDGGGYLGIHGIRILSPKHSFDLGAMIIGDSDSPTLPFVGYVKVF